MKEIQHSPGVSLSIVVRGIPSTSPGGFSSGVCLSFFRLVSTRSQREYPPGSLPPGPSTLSLEYRSSSDSSPLVRIICMHKSNSTARLHLSRSASYNCRKASHILHTHPAPTPPRAGQGSHDVTRREYPDPDPPPTVPAHPLPPLHHHSTPSHPHHPVPRPPTNDDYAYNY